MNVRETAPGVVHFEEDYRVYCTLVRGKKTAVLWDTGQGKMDLRDWMDSRVATPYQVMILSTMACCSLAVRRR